MRNVIGVLRMGNIRMQINKGDVFLVKNQGLCMTPETIRVEVHWVDDKSVWYYKEGVYRLLSTSLERFIEVVTKGG